MFCHVFPLWAVCTIVLKHYSIMPNQENNVSRVGNIWKHLGKLGNIPQQKCSWIFLKTFLLPGKQILFPQQCFPRWSNRETLVKNIMFLQQCFLVCPGLCIKNNVHSWKEIISLQSFDFGITCWYCKLVETL